jgi:hypothetical protein
MAASPYPAYKIHRPDKHDPTAKRNKNTKKGCINAESKNPAIGWVL